MLGVQKLVGAFMCVCLSVAAPVAADVVTDWNAIARQRGVRPSTDGPAGVIDLAMVHAAMHDAIQAIQGRFHTYSGVLAAAEGSEIAAAAAAAHGILVNRFQAAPATVTALNLDLANYLGTCDASCQDGVAVGVSAANAVITMRLNDGGFPGPTNFVGGTAPGQWRPTPSGPMTQAWLGDVTPFTLTDQAQFQAEPPPLLTSREYARDYNEVKSLGQNTSTTRTPAQTAAAVFFAEGPPSYWNRTLAVLVPQHVTDLGDRARLYALIHLAMADSVITAWRSKNVFNFWRPETAIQHGDADGNPNTIGNTSWAPHTRTPPYPDYTSGANNINGAVTGMLEHFFGTDEMSFSLRGAGGVTRPYERFSDVADDVCEARILEGIHFRFADSAARTQGRNVARWVYKNFLRPLHDADDDH